MNFNTIISLITNTLLLTKYGEQTNRVFDGPVWECCSITEMFEVVDVTEEFAVQLRICDVRYWAVLILGSRVADQAWGEVGQVRRDFFDHVATHFSVPDNLPRVGLFII